MSEQTAKAALVYLDNSATSFPKPASVVNAVRNCLTESLTVARSTHLSEFRADEVLKRCRIKLARFFNATAAEEMIYTYSATDGLNIALNGMIKPGGHVLVSPLEHHSVMRPLHHMRDEHGTHWTTLPGDQHGVIDPDVIVSLVKPETCCIVINWVSNVSGSMQPVAEIGEIAAQLGIPYIVDAAQATGTHDVDVQAVKCSAMAQPAHKAMMSLPGTGILYLNKDAAIKPWRIGGTGYRSDLVEQPKERPMRYESGTPNVAGIVGLDAALDWFEQTGLKNIREHCADTTSMLYEGLTDIPGIDVIGPEPNRDRGFLVSFCLGDTDPLITSQILAEKYNISSRAGLHCAPTAHQYYGTYERGGTVRFSVSYFTTDGEIEYTLSAVREIAGQLI